MTINPGTRINLSASFTLLKASSGFSPVLKVQAKKLALHTDVRQEDQQLGEEGVKVPVADQTSALAEVGIWCQLTPAELARYLLEGFKL